MTAPTKNRGGRPRDPSRDTVILDAVIAVLAEQGLTAATMDVIATAGGVGKATIYRRWSSREQLLAEALRERPPVVDWPTHPAALRPEPALARDLDALLTAFTTGDRVLAGLAVLSQLPYDEDLRQAHRAGPAAALSTAIGELCRRARHRGTVSVLYWDVPIGDVVRQMQHRVLTMGSIHTPVETGVYVDSLLAQLQGRAA